PVLAVIRSRIVRSRGWLLPVQRPRVTGTPCWLPRASSPLHQHPRLRPSAEDATGGGCPLGGTGVRRRARLSRRLLSAVLAGSGLVLAGSVLAGCGRPAAVGPADISKAIKKEIGSPGKDATTITAKINKSQFIVDDVQ